MSNTYVKCEYCERVEIVISKKYKRHLLMVHHMELLSIDDFNKKLELGKSLFTEYQISEENKNKLAFELEQDRKQKYIDDNTETYQIIWDDIIFGKNQIKFDVNRLKVILKPVDCFGFFESLNLIKREYFERLYSKSIFKLTFFKGVIVIDKSPGWKKILETVELAKEFYEYKYLNLKNHSKTKRFDYLSNEDIIKLFENSFSKSNYLNYLATLQYDSFKIIPVLEFINNHIEESFLFRIKTDRNSTLIIWENVNESRASHLFISQKDKEEYILTLLEEFICRKDIYTKRAILYSNDYTAIKIKSDLNFLKSVKHISINDYEYEINHVLKTH